MSKGIYIFLGTCAVLGLGYYMYSKSKTPSTENDTLPPVVQLDYNKVLKSGVRGEEVKELQRRLGGLAVDGIFGPLTLSRLKTVKGVTQITLSQL
ncbi:peptidoglycan-binding domain-containing protein [Flavobacterium cerinum]|uniref:Peptidoglycan-binding protein n=1 Tax=Flavobacterium cerinum TaxID=2502784 RepID=A0ABY5ISF5_9FLAO|nr:hypothetical protein [Flavobacterium cerinum]UUC45584.1 hypothetical protein NOX80_18430 [Flavobacterium cerinum]